MANVVSKESCPCQDQWIAKKTSPKYSAEKPSSKKATAKFPTKKAAKSPARDKAPLKKVAKGKVEKKEKETKALVLLAKRKRDPNAPKRPMTAFMYFAREERPKVMKDNPNFSVPEIGKELGARWRKLGDNERAKFDALAAKDMARYQAQMKKYKK